MDTKIPTTTTEDLSTSSSNSSGVVRNDISKGALENFRDVFVKVVETNTPLTPAAKAHVEARVNQFFSRCKTPHHPPYHAMIERAITELNEEGGSSEESISKFLEKEYRDALPTSHTLFLKHHLTQLCESGYIVMRPPNKYMFVWDGFLA